MFPLPLGAIRRGTALSLGATVAVAIALLSARMASNFVFGSMPLASGRAATRPPRIYTFRS